jgi:hypothetical protein
MGHVVVIIKRFREFKSFVEIRAWLKVEPGTPSLKRPAKTFAPGHEVEGRESREAMQGKADETERLRTGIGSSVKVGRGVTVVGD